MGPDNQPVPALWLKELHEIRIDLHDLFGVEPVSGVGRVVMEHPVRAVNSLDLERVDLGPRGDP
ncbi:hypothetical protein D3C75_933020 [compost metagenome]